MKNEIVRMNNLNVEYSSAIHLSDISFCVLAGECIGFLGLANSGKDLLIDIICGNQDFEQISYYINGVKISNSSETKKFVYKITDSNFIIDNWTVAEYICLVKNKSAMGLVRRKKLEEQAADLFHEYGIQMDVNKKIRHLTELEKRLVDVVKALSVRAKVLVIEDEFEGCSTSDIKQFKNCLARIIEEDMAVFINSHSDNVSYTLSDKYFIFKKGFIVKKCKKEFIENNSHLEQFLLDSTTKTKEKVTNLYKSKIDINKKIIYTVENITIKQKKNMSFHFFKGEVITILSLDVKEKEKLFALLSGRTIDKNLKIILNQHIYPMNNISDFVKNKVASIADMGSDSELFLSMSFGNNLFIPSLDKISSWQHVWKQKKMIKVLEKEVNQNMDDFNDNVRYRSVNDYILLLLERWYIYKPKVLVLLEPFVHCDVYGVSLIKSYIQKFSDSGTTIIIVKSRKEYIEDISDRILNL